MSQHIHAELGLGPLSPEVHEKGWALPWNSSGDDRRQLGGQEALADMLDLILRVHGIRVEWEQKTGFQGGISRIVVVTKKEA